MGRGKLCDFSGSFHVYYLVPRAAREAVSKRMFWVTPSPLMLPHSAESDVERTWVCFSPLPAFLLLIFFIQFCCCFFFSLLSALTTCTELSGGAAGDTIVS